MRSLRSRLPHSRRRWRAVLVVAFVIATALLGLMTSAGIFDRDALHLFPARGRKQGVSVVYFSGDMGLRHGLGPITSRALAERGVSVVGVNMPTLFGSRRTLAQTTAIVADAIRYASRSHQGDRLVAIGQSFGADILQTGLAHLPPGLRPRIAAVILVVPGQSVFFRADPTGLIYHGAPDSLGRDTVGKIDWTPLTCIYGVEERDSLCPGVRLPAAHVVAMPGGHALGHDGPALTAQILAAIERTALRQS